MTRHVPSTPKDGSKRALTSVKLSRSNERKRSRRSKTQRHARPKERIKLTSNARLLARSEEFITNLLKEFNVRPTNGDDLFGAVLNAELGKKFCHKRRVDQLKALAAGCALYHLTLRENDSAAALQRLAKSMNVDLPRTSDRYRIIVECLIDYGATKAERTLNRQFAARDARALSYVVRTKMEPQQITKPEKGESITKWADLEAEYRKPRKALHARPEMAKTGSSSESAKSELPVIPVSKRRYCVLQKWTEKGLFVVAPKDNGCPLAVIVTPLRGLTADQAKSSPAKVRAGVQRALDKIL